jgi:hypothetical protein
MAHDDRSQTEVDPDRPERRVQRHPRDDARQRDRQDHEERDRLAAEELVPLHGERSGTAQYDRDRSRAKTRLQRREQRVASTGVDDCTGEPLEREARDGPALHASFVEGVEKNQGEREVDEHEGHDRDCTQDDPCSER